MAWLDDHPPARAQSRERDDQLSGVVALHTPESRTRDLRRVAEFIRGRTGAGSYHLIGDADEALWLVDPQTHEAFGSRGGFNRHVIHVSFAGRAADWPMVDPAEVTAQLDHTARALAARLADLGIEVPARRITRAQAVDRVPGFVSHGDLDPGRRSDPGAGFPWGEWLAAFGAYSERMANSSSVLGDRTATGAQMLHYLADHDQAHLVWFAHALHDERLSLRGVDPAVVMAVAATVDDPRTGNPAGLSASGTEWDTIGLPAYRLAQAVVDRLARLAGIGLMDSHDPGGSVAFSPSYPTVEALEVESGWRGIDGLASTLEGIRSAPDMVPEPDPGPDPPVVDVVALRESLDAVASDLVVARADLAAVAGHLDDVRELVVVARRALDD